MYEKSHWQMMGKNPIAKGLRIAGFVVLGIGAAALFALVFGYLVMILWNWIMPAIFDLGTITYWQAFGLVILVKLVFGTMGRGKNHERHPKFDRSGAYRSKEEGSEFERNGKDWRIYRDFWHDVGRDAFRAYAAKRESEEKGGEEPQ
jgi:hypothetical protein